MKNKYKNIIIPYSLYLKKYNRFVYIYNDKMYYSLSSLYNAYLGKYLTYHFCINKKLKEVNDFDDILYYILENFKTFEIPNKYKSEYSNREYSFLINFKNCLLNNKINLYDNDFKFSFKYLIKYKFDYLKHVYLYNNYKNYKTPKKIILKDCIYYAYNGEVYSNMTYIVENMIIDNLYFPYSGNLHHHDFESLILSIYKDYEIFNINDDEEKYYSKQELEIIKLIIKKLKNNNFDYTYYKKYYDFNQQSYNDYEYLKNNKKYFKLFIFNFKNYFRNVKIKNSIIKAHKVKKENRI